MSAEHSHYDLKPVDRPKLPEAGEWPEQWSIESFRVAPEVTVGSGAVVIYEAANDPDDLRMPQIFADLAATADHPPERYLSRPLFIGMVDGTSEDMRQFASELGPCVPLTHEQTRELFEYFYAGRAAASNPEKTDNAAHTEPADSPEDRLNRHRVEVGSIAKQWLVVNNTRLIAYVAHNYDGRGIPSMDLISEGHRITIRAINGYDPSKLIEFSTYLTTSLKNGLSKYLKDHARAIREPVYFQDYRRKIAGVTHGFVRDHGREPTVEELSDLTEISPVTINRIAKTPPQQEVSFDAPLAEDGGESERAREDITPDRTAIDPKEAEELIGSIDTVVEGLSILTADQILILKMQTGMFGSREYPVDAIAKLFRLSRTAIDGKILEIGRALSKWDSQHDGDFREALLSIRGGRFTLAAGYLRELMGNRGMLPNQDNLRLFDELLTLNPENPQSRVGLSKELARRKPKAAGNPYAYFFNLTGTDIKTMGTNDFERFLQQFPVESHRQLLRTIRQLPRPTHANVCAVMGWNPRQVGQEVNGRLRSIAGYMKREHKLSSPVQELMNATNLLPAKLRQSGLYKVLTDQQKRLVDFLAGLPEDTVLSMTYTRIAQEFGYETESGARKLVDDLIKRAGQPIVSRTPRAILHEAINLDPSRPNGTWKKFAKAMAVNPTAAETCSVLERAFRENPLATFADIGALYATPVTGSAAFHRFNDLIAYAKGEKRITAPKGAADVIRVRAGVDPDALAAWFTGKPELVDGLSKRQKKIVAALTEQGNAITYRSIAKAGGCLHKIAVAELDAIIGIYRPEPGAD